jgi:uncharacterized protein YcbK (DUF882 family)
MPDWPFFLEDELRCPCGCGRADMDPAFMHSFVEFRRAVNSPIVLTSAFRCPEYDLELRSSRDQSSTGAHSRGRAIDANMWGDRLWNALGFAISADLLGIGLQQKGAYNTRFVHFDNMISETGRPRPWVWTY